jgi:hypothetical protein
MTTTAQQQQQPSFAWRQWADTAKIHSEADLLDDVDEFNDMDDSVKEHMELPSARRPDMDISYYLSAFPVVPCGMSSAESDALPLVALRRYGRDCS